jgi:hypothetical protein
MKMDNCGLRLEMGCSRILPVSRRFADGAAVRTRETRGEYEKSYHYDDWTTPDRYGSL